MDQRENLDELSPKLDMGTQKLETWQFWQNKIVLVSPTQCYISMVMVMPLNIVDEAMSHNFTNHSKGIPREIIKGKKAKRLKPLHFVPPNTDI